MTTNFDPATLKFDASGLIPAIAQEEGSNDVLMMAWMNRSSLAETLATGRICYWSRSRGTLWRKGDTSGHIQKLIELRYDCDADTILVLVDQSGAACHEGTRSCFTRRLEIDGSISEAETAYPTRIDESARQ